MQILKNIKHKISKVFENVSRYTADKAALFIETLALVDDDEASYIKPTDTNADTQTKL